MISNKTEAIKYMTVRFLAKFGLAWETGRWRFGLSITTPSVGLYGNGSVRREESYFVAGTSQSDQRSIYSILAENTSTTARYYHPLSVGIGIEYHAPKTRIAFSAEYFSKISSFYIMKPGSDAFVYPSSIRDSSGMSRQIEEFLYAGAAAKPVLNIGLGFDQSLGKLFNLLMGVRTDFSSYTPPDNASELIPKTGNWDFYYLSAGLSYRRTRQTMTVGVTYSFSPKLGIDPVVIVTPGSASSSKAEVFAQSFGVVLGYTYYFPK